MKATRIILNTIAACTLVMGLSACKPREEGPAEKAGKDMDNAMHNAGEKMEDMGKDVQKKSDGN